VNIKYGIENDSALGVALHNQGRTPLFAGRYRREPVGIEPYKHTGALSLFAVLALQSVIE
jgi:hypothetical protein